MAREPLRLFFSYAHEDAPVRDRLDEHLELLRRQGVIMTWSDEHITPGDEWRPVIEENMRAADIILLLVSKRFLASDFVREVEIPLALAEHDRGDARVLPVLLEELEEEALDLLPFGKLQLLPSKAKPVSDWEDPVRAFADIADGVRKTATKIVWERGGPFEFGPRRFTDAELVPLEEPARRWTRERLGELHEELTRAVPARSVDGNLLVATWSMRSLGREPVALPECRYYLAAIISAFDIVAVQEVHDELSELNRLVEILGPDWDYLVTDTSEGALGHQERFAILYYAPRVAFEHVSGELVLQARELIDGQQFARKPLIASFRAGELRFRVCTAHLHYGGPGGKHAERTAAEAAALGRGLSRRSRGRDRTSIVLAANLNLRSRTSPVVKALREVGVRLPPKLLRPTTALAGSYASAIGFVSRRRDLRLGPSDPNCGVFDFKRVLFLPEHIAHYRDGGLYRPKGDPEDERDFVRWGVLNVSDHLPLWAELAA